MAIVALALLAWERDEASRRIELPAPLAWAIGLLLAFPLLQLVPLPAGWWAALPGHDAYARVLEFAGDGARYAMRPLSIHPGATQYAWLAMLPCLAVFLLTLNESRSRLRALAWVFVGVAVVEATLGLMQLGASAGSILYFGNTKSPGLAVGTYVNRNHFSALMAMALPMAVALWALETAEPRRVHPRHTDRRIAVAILLSMVVLLLVAALLFSRSRGGISSGLLALAIASLLLVWRSGAPLAKAAFAAVGVSILVFAAYVGLTPVLERFAPDTLTLGYEGRAALSAATFRAALDFLPFGSGLGTYADVFRRYQVEGLPGFIDHAHNDYAEAFMELGVVGIAAIALALGAYAMRWLALARRRPSRSLGYLQAAAGLGMLAMIVHAAFDFNFHIPANALYFSFLAGLFFLTRDEDRASAAAAPPR